MASSPLVDTARYVQRVGDISVLACRPALRWVLKLVPLGLLGFASGTKEPPHATSRESTSLPCEPRVQQYSLLSDVQTKVNWLQMRIQGSEGSQATPTNGFSWRVLTIANSIFMKINKKNEERDDVTGNVTDYTSLLDIGSHLSLIKPPTTCRYFNLRGIREATGYGLMYITGRSPLSETLNEESSDGEGLIGRSFLSGEAGRTRRQRSVV